MNVCIQNGILGCGREDRGGEGGEERKDEYGRRERGMRRGFKSLKFYSAFSFIRTILYIDLLDWSYITDLFLLYRVFSKNVIFS